MRVMKNFGALLLVALAGVSAAAAEAPPAITAHRQAARPGDGPAMQDGGDAMKEVLPADGIGLPHRTASVKAAERPEKGSARYLMVLWEAGTPTPHENDGYWNDVVGDEAIIEDREARVFISVENDRAEMTAYGVDEATDALRQPPLAVVFIAIGHGAGSVQPAREVGDRVIAKWVAFLTKIDRDRNEANVQQELQLGFETASLDRNLAVV